MYRERSPVQRDAGSARVEQRGRLRQAAVALQLKGKGVEALLCAGRAHWQENARGV